MRIDWAEAVRDTFDEVEVGFCEAGHFPHWEIPDEAAAAIGAFFGRIGWG